MSNKAKEFIPDRKTSRFRSMAHRSARRLTALGKQATTGLGYLVVIGFIAAAVTVPAAAQVSSDCAWPLELTPHGSGNIAWPDSTARYWMMPFDPQWTSMTIKGTYPSARYMSFVTYDGLAPTLVHDSIYDAQIVPDLRGENPFVPPGQTAGTYTVTVVRDQSQGTNVIRTAPGVAWVVYRIYLPDEGRNSMGAQALPDVTLTGANANTQTLQPCTDVNAFSDVSALVNNTQISAITCSYTAPDHMWFAPPNQPPTWLFPNPNNKYINSFPGDYQPGRLIVIRGRAPAFPNTFFGQGAWQPARQPRSQAVQARYWAMCVNDVAMPYPVVGCMTDATTKLDAHGFYTLVISDDQFVPSWLPPRVNWLPWGDEQMNKSIFLRNMLPSGGFPYSVQNAIANGCTYTLNLPAPPDPSDVARAGICAQSVMADYYPVAVWCDQSVFRRSGWSGCFRAAGIGLSGKN